ncbi:hypothetical protein TNCV_5029181 [Trichonephila clavipes]|nr:hypothetical protein TNCV_5029181 [Trichonephila clavipes]
MLHFFHPSPSAPLALHVDASDYAIGVPFTRCKPAFFLNTEDLQLPQTKNETPATGEPNATASTPATVESDPTASTPTQRSTRSGRKVHLPAKIEELLSDHYLCLLNNAEKTYFQTPTTTFHSLDLAICSPALLPLLIFEVEKDLNSDHFPRLVSHFNGAGTQLRPPTYHFLRVDWDKFTRLAIITGTMVQNKAVDDVIFNVTEAIRNAADAAIPKTSNSQRNLCKIRWNASCQQAKIEEVPHH